jgi:hypothetical protein
VKGNFLLKKASFTNWISIEKVENSFAQFNLALIKLTPKFEFPPLEVDYPESKGCERIKLEPSTMIKQKIFPIRVLLMLMILLMLLFLPPSFTIKLQRDVPGELERLFLLELPFSGAFQVGAKNGRNFLNN